MQRIIDLKKAGKLSRKLRKDGKKIILSGGCFDVLHFGHIKFLEAAKKTGGILFVLLESDENVKKIKGEQRPINNQIERAFVLSSVRSVDYVILMPEVKEDIEYDKIIETINPSVIAVTKGSGQVEHAKRQAKNIGSTVLEVIARINDKSTSKIADIISKENQL